MQDIQIPAEVETLKAEYDAKLAAAEAEKAKLASEKDNVVAELVDLRKKKGGIPEEEHAKIIQERDQLLQKLQEIEEARKKAEQLKNDAAAASMASTPSVATPPPATAPVVLTPEQEQLRKEKGWTVEKYLAMKVKYPDIVR